MRGIISFWAFLKPFRVTPNPHTQLPPLTKPNSASRGQTVRGVKVGRKNKKKCHFNKNMALGLHNSGAQRSTERTHGVIFIIFLKRRWLFFSCLITLEEWLATYKGRTKSTQRGRLLFCSKHQSNDQHTANESSVNFCPPTGSLNFQLIPLSTTFHSVAEAVAEAIATSLRLPSASCPCTYLKIGSLKFTLMKPLKARINLATIERLFFPPLFGESSCVCERPRPGRG